MNRQNPCAKTVYVDLETTGLEPDDEVLEIAMLALSARPHHDHVRMPWAAQEELGAAVPLS